ncbi:MAG: CcmD family protein [Desulfovibrionaceae bacterium]
MDNTGYLLAANVLVWLGVGGFVLFLARSQKSLETRIAHMEHLGDDHDQ